MKYINNKILITSALIVVVIMQLFLLDVFSFNQEKAQNLALTELAAAVMDKCENVDYRPACYDEEIPKLMDSISMEEAFEVTKLIQEEDDSYWYCHVLGHNLSAKETAKNPDAWKGVIARAPLGVCSNGAIHGAFQEKFRTDVLNDKEISAIIPELKTICEKRDKWTPTSMQQATCYHAVGHLTMYITGADINKAVNICDNISMEWKTLCYDGAFMQIFQPLEPEDFALVEGKQPKKEKVVEYCSSFSVDQKNSCLNESWPLSFRELHTPEGLIDFCSNAEGEAGVDRCFSAMFYVMTAQFKLDAEVVSDYCAKLPDSRRDQCFSNAASRMIETDSRLVDRAVDMCEKSAKFGGGERCYNELLFYSQYNFHAGSDEFINFCNHLPDGWKEKCLKREVRSLRQG